MTWYEEWFDRDEYELVYQDRDTAEAEQLIDLIEAVARPQRGAQILDVGCGRGRHARSLARRGYAVTGVDLAPRAIEQARARAAAEGLAVHFGVADMRMPVCNGCFDGVVNLFTAFGYFDDEADHQRAAGAMAHALRPGGWLVQDFLNATALPARLVPEDTRRVGEALVTQRRRIEAGRVHKTIEIRRGEAVQTFRESVRLLTLDDFRRLYAQAGLRLEATFGDYGGAPHTDDAPRLILYARAAR